MCSLNIFFFALHISLAWIFVYFRYRCTVMKVITTNAVLYCIIMNYFSGVSLNVHHIKNVRIKAIRLNEICVLCHIFF